MKAKPKENLVIGQEADEHGHNDIVVLTMLHKGIIFLEPYLDFEGNVIPDWYCEIGTFGFNWHISWLDVIEE